MFITGTGTDVGKTYVTASLIRALQKEGCPVDALKPVVSGFDPGAPGDSDPAVLLDALGVAWSPEALAGISPWRYAAPLSPPLAARREGRVLDAALVIKLCQDRLLASKNSLLLIEGAGGVMSPLDDDHTMLDIAVGLGLPVLLVAGSYVGAVSHTLTAALALRSAGSDVLAIVVSESVGAPPIAETIDAMQRLLGNSKVIGLKRKASVPDDLVQLFAAALA